MSIYFLISAIISVSAILSVIALLSLYFVRLGHKEQTYHRSRDSEFIDAFETTDLIKPEPKPRKTAVH